MKKISLTGALCMLGLLMSARISGAPPDEKPVYLIKQDESTITNIEWSQGMTLREVLLRRGQANFRLVCQVVSKGARMTVREKDIDAGQAQLISISPGDVVVLGYSDPIRKATIDQLPEIKQALLSH